MLGRVAPPMADRVRDAFRRTVERLLPWFDPELEAERNRRTEEIRQRSIAARIRVESLDVERLREGYGSMGKRLTRR